MAAFDAYGEAVDAEGGPKIEVGVAFVPEVSDSDEPADALDLGQPFANRSKDRLEPSPSDAERIGACDPHPLGAGPRSRQLFDIRDDFLHGREPERVRIEGAEPAAVVRASRGDLEERGFRFVGRPPDGSGEVHRCFLSSSRLAFLRCDMLQFCSHASKSCSTVFFWSMRWRGKLWP